MARLLTQTRLMTIAIFVAFVGVGPAVAGDPGHGEAVFTQQCAVCHSAARGGPTLVGPNLFGVVGRPAGALKGFTYSAAMKSTGFAWSSEKLHEYLAAPSSTVPGNHMPYAGLKSPTQLDDLLAYLATLK